MSYLTRCQPDGFTLPMLEPRALPSAWFPADQGERGAATAEPVEGSIGLERRGARARFEKARCRSPDERIARDPGSASARIRLAWEVERRSPRFAGAPGQQDAAACQQHADKQKLR